MDMALKDSTDHNQFKSFYRKNIRPVKKDTYKILDRYGLKLLSCLRVDFSDLRVHRFNHNFNCSDPTCKCGFDEESTALLRSLSDAVNPAILNLPHDHLSQVLLSRSKYYNGITNK